MCTCMCRYGGGGYGNGNGSGTGGGGLQVADGQLGEDKADGVENGDGGRADTGTHLVDLGICRIRESAESAREEGPTSPLRFDAEMMKDAGRCQPAREERNGAGGVKGSRTPDNARRQR